LGGRKPGARAKRNGLFIQAVLFFCNAEEPPKVLKNKKADRVGIKIGLCPDAIQRRNRWSPKAKAVGI